MLKGIFTTGGNDSMQFFYDDKMPLRILDEGKFWKHQEREHTVVIRQLVPNLEKPFVDALAAWEQALLETEDTFTRFIETVVRSGKHISREVLGQVRELVTFALHQSEQFVGLLDQLLTGSEPVKASRVVQTVVHHIRRESEYFMGIVNALLSKNLL